MSTQLHIESQWKDTFERLGLSNYDDFFKDNSTFELIAKEKSQRILRLKVEGNIFYLKQNTPERPRKIFRQLLRGRAYSQPVTKEIRNLIYLKKNNISVMKLAAWGVRTNMGYPQTSFLIAENVEGKEFVAFYKQADCKARKKLFTSYAALVGELHAKNLDSLARLQDIFCQNIQGNVKLTMIDREEGSTKRVEFNAETAALELAKVFYHGVKKYKQTPSTREVLIFCREYLKINTQIRLSHKELYVLLKETAVAYMKTRKSFLKVKTFLPNSMFS